MVGVENYNASYEKEIVKNLGLQVITIPNLTPDNNTILQWINRNKFDYIAIHVDVDVLNPCLFYSQFSNNPSATNSFNPVKGQMAIPQLTKIIQDVSNRINVVGITFAEHMPWNVFNLKNMMEQFSFMK